MEFSSVLVSCCPVLSVPQQLAEQMLQKHPEEGVDNKPVCAWVILLQQLFCAVTRVHRDTQVQADRLANIDEAV